MELNNDIEVNASVDEVWEAFNTPEKIAPCLPGAELQENEGEEFHGIVKIKVGPITAQYKGTATYLDRNNEDKKVVIKGDGRDVRGACADRAAVDLADGAGQGRAQLRPRRAL